MGSCVSVGKSSSASGSAVKLMSFDAKHDVIFPAAIEVHHPDSASKEEMFFDSQSQAWLDSDCDDDFVSVGGDFTPSVGSTPVHHKSTMETETPQDIEKHQNCVTEVSPTVLDNKIKRLSELFMESVDDDEEPEDSEAETKSRTCMWLRTPGRSSAPATPRDRGRAGTGKQQEHRRMRSATQGCVPRLVSCSSLTERRRRKMMSPTTVAIDGNA